jgi:colanic acid biosynthesis glycosyl transferase WcaI
VRIQIVSTYFAPEHTGNAPYVTALAHHLSASHDVTVVAGLPHYPEWRVAAEWRHWRRVERQGNLQIIRLAHYVPSKQDPVRRAAYEVSWAARALAEGLRHPADVVVGVVPTLLTSQVAALIARRHGAKLGLVVQDIVSRAAAQSGMKGGKAAAGTAARIERRGLRRADGISTIHPRFARVLADEYAVPADLLRVVYNWSHIDRPTADRRETRRLLGWSQDEIVVLHSGNMGLKQGLDNVVHAGSLASGSRPRVRFVLAGNGNQRARLEVLATGVPELEIREGVEPAAFPDFLAAADVLLVNEREGVLEMSLPSKLTSYFAAGRPVVAATEAGSATADLIAASGGGVVVRPSDPQALLDAVLSMGTHGEAMDRLGKAGQLFALTQLNGESALAAYETWICGLAD